MPQVHFQDPAACHHLQTKLQAACRLTPVRQHRSESRTPPQCACFVTYRPYFLVTHATYNNHYKINQVLTSD